MTREYAERIRSKSSKDILDMFQRLVKGEEIVGWPQGIAFEYLIIRCFEIAGAHVEYPFRVEIDGNMVEQIDGSVRTDQIYMLVESKDWQSKIDIQPIAKLRHQLGRRPACVMASVFSVMGFTQPAQTLTRYTPPLNVLLWEGIEIEKMLEDAVETPSRPLNALHAKFKYAVEKAMPDYNIVGGY